MRSCEAIYGREQGDAIEELVVAATGDPCPCRRGEPCPLLDGGGCNSLAERVPQSDALDANRALAAAIMAAAQVTARSGEA